MKAYYSPIPAKALQSLKMSDNQKGKVQTMKTKLHPRTQAKVNEYARRKLALYRASRSAGTSPTMARWQSSAALAIGMTYDTKAEQIIRARETHLHFMRNK